MKEKILEMPNNYSHKIKLIVTKYLLLRLITARTNGASGATTGEVTADDNIWGGQIVPWFGTVTNYNKRVYFIAPYSIWSGNINV